MTQLRPWRVVESKISYRDRWLNVRSDHCRTATGSEVRPYHVLEYPDWVNVVALVESGQCVLVWQYRHGVSAVVPGLPSGVIEAGDRSPEEAARRELLEETGYAGGHFMPICSVYANPANQTNTVWSFLAMGLEGTPSRSADPREETEVVLVDLPRLLTKLRSGEMKMQAFHVAALWSAVAAILTGGDGSLIPLRRRLSGDVFGCRHD